MKSKKDYNLYRKRFQDVVKFLVVKEILKKYESFEQYKKASNSDKAYKLHSAILPELLKSLGRLTKKYNTEKFICESENIFTYHFHCNKKYKSGKRFQRNSWFEMSLEIVKFAFENKKDWNIANDKLFSKDAHIWVDKNIYYTADNYYNRSTPEKKEIFDKILHNIKEEIKEEENNMTKLERIQYQKDYEAGLKAFPLEVVLKAEAKKKRADEKRLKTKIKKMTQQVMVEEELEIQRLKKEIEKLRAENNNLKSLKDLNSDIPEEKEKEEELVIEYEDLDKYFPDGIDQDNPEHRELMKHFSEHCKMRLDYEYENQHKAMMEETPMTDDEAEAQIAAAERLRDSGELNKEEFKEEPPANVAVVKQDKTTILQDDDIPTEEEQLAQRKKLLSYRLQEFHDKGYLQASEAERLRQCSTYADKLPKIKDNGVILSDTSKQFDARLRICTYINKHKEEFGLDLDVVDLDALHKELYRWVAATAKCCAAAC